MTTIKLRRGTAAQWTSANSVLAIGEPGVEADTGKFKIGDGSTSWAALPYATAASRLPGSVATVTPGSSNILPRLYLDPPSGDATGKTDMATMNAAISALTAGGGVIEAAAGDYHFNGEIVLPSGAGSAPTITIEGQGRYTTVFTWPTDLGSGKYAIRTSDSGGPENDHRVKALALTCSAGPGTYASPVGMHGMNLSSGGAADDVVIQNFNRGLSITNGNQRYENCHVTNNYDNLFCQNNIGTGDVSITDTDLAGAVRSSVFVDGGSLGAGGQCAAFFFKRVHTGFAPVCVYLGAGSHGGISYFGFDEVVWEGVGNAIFYAPPSVTGGVGDCVFKNCQCAADDSTAYYEAGLPRTAAINMSGGVWAYNDVVGVDSLVWVNSGFTAFIIVNQLTASHFGNCVSLLGPLNSNNIPFAIAGFPSQVEVSDGKQHMNAQRLSTGSVRPGDIVQPDTYEQVKPMTSGPELVASGIAQTPADSASGAATLVGYEGLSQVRLADDVGAGNVILAPSNTTPTQAAAIGTTDTGVANNILGWSTQSGSAGTLQSILLRPQKNWKQNGTGSLFVPASVACWYPNPLITATSISSSDLNRFLAHLFFSGASGLTVSQMDTSVQTAYGAGGVLRVGIYVLVNQLDPFNFQQANRVLMNLLYEAGTLSLTSTGNLTLTLPSSQDIPPNTWFAVAGVEQGSASGTRLLGGPQTGGNAWGVQKTPSYGSAGIALLKNNVTGTLPATVQPDGVSSVDAGVGIYRSA